MTVDISVVVATLDRAHMLSDVLGALLAQEVPPGLAWEVVVVDNGSTDGTQAAVGRIAPSSPVPIRTIVEPERGLSNARNRGITESRGAIIAFTDDDVLPPPGWVAAIADAMTRTGADVLGGRILPLWASTPPDWLLRRRELLDRLAIMDHPSPATLALPIAGPAKVWGANMAFRRSVFETIGGFDPRLGVRGERRFRGEETNLIERAIRRGHRVVYEPEVVVLHRIGPERLEQDYFRRLAFDAGLLRARLARLEGRRTLFGAPIRQYRLPLFVARWAVLRLRGRRDAFDRELRWRFRLGRLVGFWERALGRAGSSPPAVAPTSPGGR